MENPNQNRLSQIDALRGLAALVVLAFHYTTRYDQLFIHTSPLALSVDAGQKGVFLFFAISGFVIFMTLDRVREPMDFVVSRFSRLYPVYWASVLVTAVVLSMGDLPGFVVTFPQVLANLTMFQGFFHGRNVDGVYWSLQIELLFYIWALGLWVVGAVRRTVAVCIAWSALALAANVWDMAAHPLLPYTVRYFMLLDFIPFFVLGMIAYVSLRDRRFDWTHATALALSIATIASAGDQAMTVVAIASVALVFAASRGHLKVLEHRTLLFFGAISYPLYLTHQLLGQLVILHLEKAGVMPWLAIAAATVVAILVAAMLHFAVEMPAMKGIRGRYRRHREARGASPRQLRRLPWLLGSGGALAAFAVAYFVTAHLDRGARQEAQGAPRGRFEVVAAPQLGVPQGVANPVLVMAPPPEGRSAKLESLLSQQEALEGALRSAATPDSSAVLLQAGEADAIAGTPALAFHDQLVALRDRLDRVGLTVPLIVARNTYCSGHASAPLRRAVERAAASRTGIYVGPDIDQLDGSYRLDDCALNPIGRARAAEMWRASVRNMVPREVRP